jgi:hypothetical protein
MMTRIRGVLIAVLITGSAMAANGCYHIKGSGTPPTPPSGFTIFPSGQPTPTPSGNCRAQDPSAQIVEVSPEINPTTDPTYGKIGEYALLPASGGFPLFASVIRLTSIDVVQFANIDTVNVVSAVGMGTSGFPPIPFTFPSGSQNPIGTAIGSSTWSTGRLRIAVTNACFSQTFTLPQVSGTNSVTAYFGDFDRYNFGPFPFRNVIVVTAPAAHAKRRPPPPLILPPHRP